jgi:hypothetical protein
MRMLSFLRFFHHSATVTGAASFGDGGADADRLDGLRPAGAPLID